jgi:putative ABC transport system permease protein
VGASLNSLFALLIGLFIIYNTFSIAVTQRRPEIGILRSLGASRGQIRRLFLIESALMGLTGSLTGVVFGLLMARAMAGYIGAYLGELYGVAQQTEEIAADPAVLLAAVAIGVVTSLAAAWIPANDAARVDPVKAIHKGAYESFTDRENRARLVAAAGFAAVAVVCSMSGGASGPRLYAGYLAVVMTAIMLTPAMVKRVVQTIRPLLRSVLPVEGALAADSLMQSPRRTSATVAAVMLSLSLVIGLGGVAAASYQSIFDWMTAALNPDLFVGSSEQISDRSFRFPPEIGEELRKMDFVDEVQMVRTARVLYKDTPVMMVTTSLESLGRRIQPKVVAGDLQQAYRDAAQGKGIVLSDNLALQSGLKLGDVMEIRSPSGILRLPVLAITIDFSDQRGALLMDRSLYVEKWKDPTVNLFRVYTKKGIAPEEAKRRILERFASERKLFVMTNQQVREYILKVTDQWFGLTYMQIFVAVLVAVLGIINSLTVSITDRRRELGVLQAVGALRRQVRQAVWMEAVGIGLVSLVLGLVLGGVILQYYLDVIREDLAGLRLEYQYPVRIALMLIPTMLATAFASALWPAETAVRSSLVEALEYE